MLVVGSCSFRQSEPRDRGGDVDAAVGRVGAPGEQALGERQQLGKEHQKENAWDLPPNEFIKPQPGPEGEAVGYIG